MTKAERAAAMNRAMFTGLLLGIVPGAIGLIFGAVILRSALLGVMLCLALIPLVAFALRKRWYAYVKKSQQSFLASTEFAKSQGIEAEDIQLLKGQDL